MLEELYTFITRINRSYRLSMPRVRGYLDGIYRGVDRLIDRNDRFVSDPIPSNGIDYLNSLISRADLLYIMKFKNDVERLTRITYEYKGTAYSDYIRQYPVREKSFIWSQKRPTAEFILITDDFNLTDELPFGSDDIEDWYNVRPLRMLSNDSPEVLLDITTSKLKYKNDPPIEAVFSINVIKLLMVYTKYRILFPEEFTDMVNNYPFIYKVCLLPLLEDNLKTYMLTIIHDMVKTKLYNPENMYDASSLVVGEKSHFLLSSRQPALLEIEDLIQKCVLRIVKPEEVLVSLEIAPGVSIYDEICWLTDSHYIGNRGTQYKWAEFEREYYVLSIMVGLYNLQPEHSRSQELKKMTTILFRRLENSRFWSQVGNPFVANHIKEKFEQLTKMFI